MRRTIVLVAVRLVSCTSSIAPSPTPATNTGVTSLAPSPTSSATIAAIVTAPPANASPTPIPLPSFADIAAAGSGVVWVLVADQHLFRSLDRGATWEERDVPQLPLGPMKNISFVDDRDGWLLTVGSPATGCMAQGFTVWRTTDGASTWERAHQATFSSSPLAGGCKSRVAFVDPQHGYIDVAGRDVPPAVLRTSDGGTTWTLSQRLPDPPGFVFEPSISTLQPGALGDFGSVVLVSAGSFVNGTAQRHIFRSTDHGATWSYIRTAPSDADIVFLTPTRWLQVVPGSSSVETTDAGASWHAFATDYSQAAAVAPQIVFGDSTTGYASVRGTLQRTTDAGAHWTSLTTPGT